MTVYALINKLRINKIKLWEEEGELKFKAPKGAFTEEIRMELVNSKSDVVAFLRDISNGNNSPSINKIDRSEYNDFPLSFSQERLWFINQLEPDNYGYNIPAAVTISGDFNIEQVESVVNQIIHRHENLRTIFPSENGQAKQLILDRIDFKFELLDLTSVTDHLMAETLAQQSCKQEAEKPFDLSQGPLLRGKVVKLSDRKNILMFNMHHIISDGWSMGIFLREFSLIMDAVKLGNEIELPPLSIQYVDYSIWQRSWLNNEGLLQKQLDYWQSKLAGVPECIDLVTDFPRPAKQSHAGDSVFFELDVSLTQQLKDLAEDSGCTFFMALLSVFKVLLFRYTGQSDICIGSPIANRQYGETEELIGMFVNTLAMRTQLNSEESFRDVMSKVRMTCLEAYKHQDAPFEKIVDLIQPQRNMASTPLFQIMMILQNTPMETFQENVQTYEIENHACKFDLTLEFTETEGKLKGVIRYCKDLFKSETIERMAMHFSALSHSAVASSQARISSFNYISTTEKKQLLSQFNNYQAEYPVNYCLHQLFARQVALNPDKIAVVCDGSSLSYQQLYLRSSLLASHLRFLGTKPDALVGLCVERSIDLLVGVLGILQAGAAYLPLDPDYPENRLEHMLNDSQAEIILALEKSKSKLKKLIKQQQLITLDSQWDEIADNGLKQQRLEHPNQLKVKPDNLAYIIYTSGSTGQSKGVMIEHRMVVDYVYSVSDRMNLDNCETFAYLSTFAADLGNTTLFPPLILGKTVHMISNDYINDPARLLDYVNQNSIDCMKITPSHFEMFRLSDNRIVLPEKVLIFGGEALSYSMVELAKDTKPRLKIYNHYGPTETTVGKITTSELNYSERQNCFLGKPLNNTKVYVLDKFNQLQPIGIPGELHISGPGVARGYLNKTELSAEKFIENPFEKNDRLYKTGDLVRWANSGDIEFLGRIDSQVKIRGFRIETGEIEEQINTVPSILDSAVVAQGENANIKLIAFYVLDSKAENSQSSVNGEQLKNYLLKSLPEYMIPVAFVCIDSIPVTANGKVDQSYLKTIEVNIESSKAYQAPGNVVEEKLVNIWSDILGISAGKIGVNDDFFELGGHSLMATQVISQIRKQLAVEIPLKAIFEKANISLIAKLISSCSEKELPVILPVNRASIKQLPLSYSQERLWFINQLEPESTGYSSPGAVIIGNLFKDSLIEQAINITISRHENLRTVFPDKDGLPCQQIKESAKFVLEKFDLSDVKEWKIREEKAKEICHIEATTPFNLSTGPLIRGRVIKLTEDQRILMLNMHHIISDGWSMGVLIKEFSSIIQDLINNKSISLTPLPIQYADYSLWQRQWLEKNGLLEKQLGYWRKKLADMPESLDLVSDFPRPKVQSFAGTAISFNLDKTLAEQLKSLAENQSCTLYMTLLAIFKVLLFRYTGQQDICVGSPIANRQYGETEGLIGMFVNTLAMRSQLTAESTFIGFLNEVKQTCLEAYEYQDTPFEKVVAEVQPKRNMAISPLFQVMLILQNSVSQGQLSKTFGEDFKPYPLDKGISKFDMTLEFTESEQGLSCQIEYSTALYKAETIERIATHFVGLCRAIIAAPELKLSEYSYLSAPEQQQLLVEFNQTRKEYPQGICLHQLFIAQATKTPDAIAAVCEGQAITYQQLLEKSQTLALYLQGQGVEPDSLVGICVHRSPDMLVGMLAILQAGGAYVALDPEYPQERLAYILQDSQAKILLTQQSLVEELTTLISEQTQLLAFDQEWTAINEYQANQRIAGVTLVERVKPNHLAYVIYTSGSTGQPKGVAIEHHSPVTLVQWAGEVYGQVELKGVLASTSLCFDLSIYEIFVPLSVGGKVIIVANALGVCELADKSSVSLLNTVPSAMEELLRLKGIPESVKTINLAGEPLSAALVDRIYESSNVEKVYDLYGPSEDTTYSTFYLREKNGAQTIGRPLANTQVYMLDKCGNVQPVGMPGELHIGGEGLARGYLHQAKLTDEKFINSDLAPGGRLYRTGDLARWLSDGTIEYLGRIDTQVKVRGFRIEIGEIESQLLMHKQVKDCAVVAQGEGSDKQLVGFYVVVGKQQELAGEILRDHLRQHLPEYMLPATFVALDKIPLMPNGKVNRRALVGMKVSFGASASYQAARNETEKMLVDIWAQVLGLEVENTGVHDNFFELGGHSLLATQLLAKIRHQFSQELPLKVLFENTSIAQQANLVEKGDKFNKSQLPEIIPVDRSLQNYFPLSYSQERLWFIDKLTPDNASYNIVSAVKINGVSKATDIELAFNTIIERHESLRTVFPEHEGKPVQRVIDSFNFKLRNINLSRYKNKKNLKQKSDFYCQLEAETPFDLATGPLVRGLLIKQSRTEHILLVNMHHIISDGWSMGVLIREFNLLMNSIASGKELHIEPLGIQYIDYAIWQRAWIQQSGLLTRQLNYWTRKLDNLVESIDLISDYPRPAKQNFKAAVIDIVFSKSLTKKLNGFAEKHSATLYMVLLAALKILLYRYSGKRELCIGSPIANRQLLETNNLIGMFVNTLALRTDVNEDDSFIGFLEKVKETCLGAYENQDVPFERVIESLDIERDMAKTPLFQIMFMLQNAVSQENRKLADNVKPYPVDNKATKFDLTIELTESSELISGSIKYATSLYKAKTINRMSQHLINICEQLLAAPDVAVSNINFISDNERNRILNKYNQTNKEYNLSKCFPVAFYEQAEKSPQSTAIISASEKYTYKQLADRSRTLALFLIAQGAKPESLIAVCMEQSFDMMVTIIGIMLAGSAYVPLDPEHPDERIRYMLKDSNSHILLTQKKFKERLKELIKKDTQLIEVDQRTEQLTSFTNSKNKAVSLLTKIKPSQLAYVIYTSGSTGQPKGVMVEHQNLTNYLNYCRDNYLGSNKQVASFTHFPLTFDASVTSLFTPLMAGRALEVSPKNNTDIFKDGDFLSKDYDFVKLTPGHLLLLKNSQKNLSKIKFPQKKRLIVGGEALTTEHLSCLEGLNADIDIINEYGPTETTVGCTTAMISIRNRKVNEGQSFFEAIKNINIGQPVANTQIYILDKNGNPQPEGIVGEIYISGAGVARGYLNRKQLTAERFLKNPFVANCKMYKSGDLGRWLDNGQIEYFGRADTQVKLRGYRIETGEIEAELNRHPLINDSVVVIQGKQQDKHLVAFYISAKNSKEQLATKAKIELLKFLARALPEYMLPAEFVKLDSIPLTINGKVDRALLESTKVQLTSTNDFLPPTNKAERQLVEIWSEILKIEQQEIGVQDSFFELGGHSILAVSLLGKINLKYNLSLPLAILFEAPDIASLSRLIKQRKSTGNEILVPIQSVGNDVPVFAIPGIGGNVLAFSNLSYSLGKEQPFYGLQTVGLSGESQPFKTVEETAKANIVALKSILSEGPYRLIGHSYGGVVAYEMANQLQQCGEQVSSLIMLDSLAPPRLTQQKTIDPVNYVYDLCESLAHVHDIPLTIEKTILKEIPEMQYGNYIAQWLMSSGIEISARQCEIYYKVYRSNEESYQRYKPVSVENKFKVALIKAKESSHHSSGIDKTFGWERLLPNKPVILDVNGTHTSMLGPEHSAELSNKILSIFKE